MFGNKPITFSPEFLTAANPIEDFQKQGMMYIGGGNTKFWRKLFQPYFTVTVENPRELIIAKLFRNAFLATKVTFFNQIYDYCKEHGLDYNTVNSLIAVDKRIGHSHTAVPGDDGVQGFGGRCLPKDVEALLNTDPEKLTVLAEIMRYNRGIRKDLKLLREQGQL
jgi:UDPglucose 6-dehydrogenase